MYKINKNAEIPVIESSRVAIDQYPAQDFNRGLNGLPANDLTLLERAQSLAEAQMVAARLQEMRDTTDLSDYSDREIVKMIKPSWVQSPAEIDRFMDYYNANVVEPMLSAKKSESASEPASEPASSPAPAE